MAIDTTIVRSRRAILLGAVGGLIASMTAVVERSSSVDAANNDIVKVGNVYSGTNITRIDVTGGATGFMATSDTYVGLEGHSDSYHGVEGTGLVGVQGSSGAGTGVRGDGSYAGVWGNSDNGPGVWGTGSGGYRPGVLGQSTNQLTGVQGFSGPSNAAPYPPAKTGVYGSSVQSNGIGVTGYNDAANGTGVYGHTVDASSETYGVHGRVAGALGRGVFGWATSTQSGGTGVWGQSNSATGVGVRGYAWDGDSASGNFGTGVMGTSGSHTFPPPAPRANTGVMGVAVGSSGAGVHGSCGTGSGVVGFSSSGTAIIGTSTSGVGVRGTSKSHRGGVFTSPVAQLRLYPASASTHPSSGLAGDLFLDSGGRLWFCQGGTTWKQIAFV